MSAVLMYSGLYDTYLVEIDVHTLKLEVRCAIVPAL